MITSKPVILSIPDHVDIDTEFQPDNQWRAIDRNTYDAESDSEGWWSKSPVGYGDTEAAAIADLLDQLEDES
jgi:hypothetical protein